MKTIKLNRMELRNFKGVVQAEYDFAEHTSITGANATGKSTIYEAYLWCLFDKNALGNAPKVQPLDANNDVKHKLDTSVKLYLDIDGNPMIVERILQENWFKKRGAAELTLAGTKNEYAINEVPMSKTQYDQKLAEIMPLDKWFIISSIGIIPSMDQKTCRAALMAIAPTIDEREVAAAYPAVLGAMDKGISVDELAAINKSNKKKAQEELDSIPAAMAAQDRLRVTADFDSLEKSIAQDDRNIAEYKTEIETLQRGLQDVAAITKAQELRSKLAKVNEETMQIEHAATQTYLAQSNDIGERMNRESYALKNIEFRIQSDRRKAESSAQELEGLKSKLSDYRTQWIAKNNETYSEPTISGVCPACCQPLPVERIEAARKAAYNDWNTKKVAALNELQRSAEDVKSRIDQVAKENAAAMEAGKQDDAEIDEIRRKLNGLQTELNNLPKATDRLAADARYNELLSERNALEQQINDLQNASASDQMDVNARIAELNMLMRQTSVQRDERIKLLAGRETNKNIDAERQRLEERESNLGGLIAEYEGVEAEIAGFRKAIITAVEVGVSSLFSMVRWKMYEPNVTNDGEKEICQAIIDGIPYEQQNNAMRINAGVDIVNGFAAAYGVCAPLFIDNAESATNIIATNGQRILLSVDANTALKFAYNQ